MGETSQTDNVLLVTDNVINASVPSIPVVPNLSTPLLRKIITSLLIYKSVIL